MGSWASDASLVDLMREFVVATNRLRYAEQHPDTTAHTVAAGLRRDQAAAAAAYEAALLERGWQIPGMRSRFPEPRAAVSY
jgi:hypothetical protein